MTELPQQSHRKVYFRTAYREGNPTGGPRTVHATAAKSRMRDFGRAILCSKRWVAVGGFAPRLRT